MGALSNFLNVAGLVLLAHAVYSAQEHASLHSAPSSASTATNPSAPPAATSPAAATAALSLPLDIIIELLVAVLLTSTGIVLASPELKPIQWRQWAGQIEREGVDPKVKFGEGVGRSPFGFLDERRGFTDVRAQRKEFADWVRAGEK